MSGPQFFETRIGRQYYEVTLPELVRQLHRLNDLLALGIEQLPERPGSHVGTADTTSVGSKPATEKS